MSSRGACFACLLRVGLEPGHEEEPPVSAIFGDFEIARLEDGSWWELGRGAMGVTYHAIDRVLHRSVALKVIDFGAGASDAEAVRERFLREARAAAALRHKNVAGIFQFGASSEAGRCYYAMELVEGETLEARVGRAGPLPVAGVLEIAVQVTAALVAAAPRGLIHRDLKPGNLMLSGGNDAAPELEVKVIDFGLAKAVSAAESEAQAADFARAGAVAVKMGQTNLTQGGFIGTPAFASPEQLERGAVDARSDIYSLGVTLWYALTGVVPFRANTLDEMRQHPARALLPVEQLAARRVPAPVTALLRSMLAVAPAGRPASARALLAQLETCRQRCGIAGSSRKPLAAERKRTAIIRLASPVLASAALAAAAWWYLSRPPAKQPGAAGPVLSEKSIAVLPFANLSPSKEDAFFIDGMQDQILTDLAQVAALRVISRTSVTQYQDPGKRNLREIGQQLGVAYLLEGSVQRAGGKVRVNAQLIDARTDAHQWAANYDRPLDDVFAIQSEIAKAISDQLQAKLSPSEKLAIEQPPTSDLSAFDLYSQAESLLLETYMSNDMEPMFLKVIRLLNQAIARDPTFLHAYCELAYVDDMLYLFGFDRTPGRLALADAAVSAAVRLRPDAAETHLARAHHLYSGYLDYDGALAELARARADLPDDPHVLRLTGYILRRQGKWEEALRCLQAALALDPRNFALLQQVALSFRVRNRYAEAAAMLDRALAIRPGDVDVLVSRASWELDWKGDPAPLQRTIDSVLAVNPAALRTEVDAWFAGALAERDAAAAERALSAAPEARFSDGIMNYSRAVGEGIIGRMTKDDAKAHTAFAAARVEQEQRVREQPDYGPPLGVLGLIDAGLGRKEEALREARHAVELLPVAKDAIKGEMLIENLATVAAWVGDKDLACAQLATSMALCGLTYGQLKLSPYWDPLRGDPRFEAMVASLAPK